MSTGHRSTAPALACRGVGVSFAGVRALDGVDLVVGPGEIVGLIGANGAGKTTLFDCLSGLVACEGQMWLGGKEITSLPAHERARAGLGRSFQDARLFHSLTVVDALRVAAERHLRAEAGLFATLARTPRARQAEARVRAEVEELVARFGLGAFRDKLVSELSTGTRRVVDLAAIFVQRPSVVLLDEPSSGIAQREAEALVPLLRRVRDELGCALLVIEHDMPLLLQLAERLYALETGRVVAQGEPQAVVSDPQVVRAYLGGDPAAVNRSGTA